MSYILSWRRPKKQLQIHPKLKNYEGRYFSKNAEVDWKPYISIRDIPINYLEIGCADGGNLINIANSYGKNQNSKLYCIDPWDDYSEYSEYKGLQNLSWINFNKNIKNAGIVDKCIICRGLSEDIVPTFDNNFFDIIFVDGNHKTEYVYNDGKMAYDKCKVGGYIIFDDYCPYYDLKIWPETAKGIDRFLNEYADRVKIISQYNNFVQLIIQKI